MADTETGFDAAALAGERAGAVEGFEPWRIGGDAADDSAASVVPTTEQAAEAESAPTSPELPADVLEHPQVKEWREQAEKAERYAPTLAELEQRGLTDSQAIQRQEQQSAEQQRLEAHFDAKYGEFYAQALNAPNAQLDADVDAGLVSEEYAQKVREFGAEQQAGRQLAEYQGQVAQQISQQRAAEDQFSRDAAALRSRDEYKVGGEALDETLFNAFASAMPDAPLADVAKALHAHTQQIYDRALIHLRASEAKRAAAPPTVPGNGAHSPSAPAPTDWKNPRPLGQILREQMVGSLQR